MSSHWNTNYRYVWIQSQNGIPIIDSQSMARDPLSWYLGAYFKFSASCQIRASISLNSDEFDKHKLNMHKIWTVLCSSPSSENIPQRVVAKSIEIIHTVYPKKYAHGFVVLCFVVVMQSFIMNSHEVFIHIHQGCFAGTGTIVRLPQCQWSKPDGYGKIGQCITTTKHSKAKTVCIFLGIYCTIGTGVWVSDKGLYCWYKHGKILIQSLAARILTGNFDYIHSRAIVLSLNLQTIKKSWTYFHVFLYVTCHQRQLQRRL